MKFKDAFAAMSGFAEMIPKNTSIFHRGQIKEQRIVRAAWHIVNAPDWSIKDLVAKSITLARTVTGNDMVNLS